MAVQDLLSRLDKCRASGRGKWMACCPAHKDSSPSLGIKELDDGRILINCFAGCSAEEVILSVGLEMTDLFPPMERNYKPTLPSERNEKPLSLAYHELVVAVGDRMTEKGMRMTEKQKIAVLESYKAVNGVNK